MNQIQHFILHTDCAEIIIIGDAGMKLKTIHVVGGIDQFLHAHGVVDIGVLPEFQNPFIGSKLRFIHPACLNRQQI